MQKFDMAKYRVGGDERICVVGLGYVGLPLFIALSKRFEVVGYDIDSKRVDELNKGIDRTRSVEYEDLICNSRKFYNTISQVPRSNVYIITVPTPVDSSKNPDLTAIDSAALSVASVLNNNDLVILESTVYPGLTLNHVVPIIEKKAGLKLKTEEDACVPGFYIGYSPERINPGDYEHTFETTTKIVSGHGLYALDKVASIYESVVTAGVHRVASVPTAEAAKVIENIQRDVNIALVNELALLFYDMGISIKEVLQAAQTKWNFIDFQPGFVGGHCIGVDPYYLLHAAKKINFYPAVIDAGRSINDGMVLGVFMRFLEYLASRKVSLVDKSVLVCGVTFKANCNDTRNSQSERIIDLFRKYGSNVCACDPWVAPGHDGICTVYNEVNDISNFDIIVFTVDHDEFKEKISLYRNMASASCIIADFKGFLNPIDVDWCI